MRLYKATEKDSERLKNFFAKTVIPGVVDLRYKRVNSYFDLYRLQSDNFKTYILEDHKGDMIAQASLVFRKAWIQGKEKKIAYATDLRVAKSRRAIIQWAKHYLPALEDAKKEYGVDYFFSAVPRQQTQAYNTFVRPRSNRREFPRYYLFRNYSVVNIHGIAPFAPAPLKSITIRKATPKDLDALSEYVALKKRNKPITFCKTADDFKTQLNQWKGLDIQDFSIALDSENNIVGCVAPWSNHNIQDVYAEKYSQRGETLRGTLKALSSLRIAHRLPKEGQPIKAIYLTHFLSNHPEVFYALLYKSFKSSRRDELLIYRHFEGHLPTLPPRSFIHTRLKYGLYCVLSPTDLLPDFLMPATTQTPPDFELNFM